QHREIEWEEFCLHNQESQDLGEMLKAVSRGHSHYQAVYALEASLWAYSMQSEKWRDILPTARTLSRTLKAHDQGSLYQLVKTSENCYKTAEPIAERTRNLGDILARVHELKSIDWEILAWASSIRWLSRSRSPELASLCMDQYQNLSFV